MTQLWYATLRHPKMHPHTKFGIPTSKNIGDMDRTRKRDGRTVRLLYASQSSFGGIKTTSVRCLACNAEVSDKVKSALGRDEKVFFFFFQ